jgi:hypothetical protein
MTWGTGIPSLWAGWRLPAGAPACGSPAAQARILPEGNDWTLPGYRRTELSRGRDPVMGVPSGLAVLLDACELQGCPHPGRSSGTRR